MASSSTNSTSLENKLVNLFRQTHALLYRANLPDDGVFILKEFAAALDMDENTLLSKRIMAIPPWPRSGTGLGNAWSTDAIELSSAMLLRDAASSLYTAATELNAAGRSKEAMRFQECAEICQEVAAADAEKAEKKRREQVRIDWEGEHMAPQSEESLRHE